MPWKADVKSINKIVGLLKKKQGLDWIVTIEFLKRVMSPKVAL